MYRSSDGGLSWTDITDQLTAIAQTGTTTTPAPIFERVEVSPGNKDVLLAVGKKRAHFVSEDAGRTWRKLKQYATIHNFVFHPKNPKWALLSSWTDACKHTGQLPAAKADDADATKAKSDGPCNHILFVTKDLGLTFKLVTSYVVQFAWGEEKQGQQDRIYFSHFNQKVGNQPRLTLWSKDVDFVFTDRFSVASSVTSVQHGNKFGVFNG